ncbi:MAG: InlB B-repeat-containing protein [Alcanivorax nanhaiticus]
MKGTFRIASLAVAVAIAGCGGGGGSSGGGKAPQPAAKSAVSGAVTKGPVAGAELYLYRMDAAGNKTGDAVAGPIQTAADGSWSVQLPGSIPRPLLIESSGGTYTDEATGGTVNAGSLNSFLPEGAETAAVTPLSELLVRSTREHLASNPGDSIEAGIDAGAGVLDDVLGVTFDPLTTVPSTTGDDAAAKQYAAVLGGLSTQANTLIGSADPFDTVMALIEDASDGVVDGKKNGNPIPIGVDDGILPDTSGDDLVTAINDYASNNEELNEFTSFTVTASAVSNGSVSPSSVSLLAGASVSFDMSPDTGYSIAGASGCDGTLSGASFTTAALSAACELSVSFEINSYEVTAANVPGGQVLPASALVDHGSTAQFEVTPDTGWTLFSVEGCGGTLQGTTYTTGPITEACTISPTYLQNEYAVESSVVAGQGSFDPLAASVLHGENASFTVTPDFGYQLDSVAGDSCEVAATGNPNEYTVGPVTSACALEASFSLLNYTVTPSVSGNGSVSPASAVMVQHGNAQAFTLTPDAGQQIAAVGGTCGGALDGATYTTLGITGDCLVEVSFEPVKYQVSTLADHGSFTPANPMVDHGQTQVFTVTADEGYELAGVSGCGGTLEGNTFTTGTITAECSVTATFAIKTYTITASVDGGNGMIGPNLVEDVEHGNTETFTVTADEGYVINTVSGCGGTMTDATTYTTDVITEDCTISVSFVEDGAGPTAAVWDNFNWDQANWQ